MKNWLWSLFLFNLIDTATTIYLLSNELGHEYNPIVRFLYGISPGLFILVKVLIGWFAIGLVVAHPKPIERNHRLTIIVSTVFYGFLSLYQALTLALIFHKGA